MTNRDSRTLTPEAAPVTMVPPTRRASRAPGRIRRIAFAALALVALAGAPAFAPVARAQFGAEIPKTAELLQVHAAPVKIAAGGTATATVELVVKAGWHINANPAANEDAIPTEIHVTTAGGVSAGKVAYPEPKIETLSFDPQPLLVFDGTTRIPVTLRAGANAASGKFTLSGKVGFQACNDQICLPPASAPFTIEVEVTGGAAPAAGDVAVPANPAPGGDAASATAPDSSEGTVMGGSAAPPAGDVFQSGPPPSGAGTPNNASATSRQLDAALARGGLWFFLALFVGGLLLNLTPCVFPMLGVTVSIFGARRKEPIARVLTHATLYVLGICVMYSSLGVAAALTGGLFGAALQNLWVLAGLGVLMVVLSLSMFGLYELQPPPWVLERLGGASTASFAGTFMAGLGVGVIAAPCVGPFVVAVLALIAQRQSPLFGFQTMFTLSLGLGLPYLVLGTFSNLLQKLPRSGDWMEWVKAVFGVILATFGLYFVTLGLAPKLVPWVSAAGLVLGGIYLGFVERTKGRGPGFVWLKRIAGTAAMAVGVALVLTMPKGTIEFRTADDAALKAAVASGRPVLLEFSADWCVPCHELERATFSDNAVIAASRDFHAFKVDLTRYDSPEAEAWRKNWNVTGVPTVIFVAKDGTEIPDLRVEGFIPPGPFLDRMKAASRATLSAAMP